MNKEKVIHDILDSLSVKFAETDVVVSPERLSEVLVKAVDEFADQFKMEMVAAIPGYVKSWYERGSY